ncbi:hypothetical protein [Angustibacter aerolatus]
MRRLTTAGVVAGALVVGAVVSPAASATAAAAKSVLLGHANRTTATTSITNTKGTALSLSAGKGKAPLAVNSRKTVKNLSSDLLDGHSSSDFLGRTAKAADADKVDGRSSTDFASAKGITGTVVASDAAAVCPAGTVLTGGGGLAETGIALSGPDTTEAGAIVPNTWLALAVSSDETDVISLATCYSPLGKAIPGAIAPAGATARSTALAASPAQRAYDLKLAQVRAAHAKR